jgi:HAD superfamily hydrolase (TIGR01509 family)
LELSNRKEELYRETFLPLLKPIDGAVEFLENARELGVKMAVATSAPDENIEFVLDGLNLRQYFHAVVGASDITYGKPHPEIFLKSAAELNVQPKNSLVFEDALNGFEAAHRAGMKSIGIATVNPIEEILKRNSVVEAHADFTRLHPCKLIERYTPLKTKVN